MRFVQLDSKSSRLLVGLKKAWCRSGEVRFTEQGFHAGGGAGDQANFSYRARP